MYLEHFGLTEPPFRITPHTEFFFAGANRGATLDALIYSILHDEGIVKVSGEVGSGKTMLCRVLMERLPDHVMVVYLANPTLSRDDIVFAIADELALEIPQDARPNAAIRALQARLIELHGNGRQVIALIDEAHAMPLETLEEIRLLSNLETSQHKLLQLVLFGQPELDDILARPDIRQLRERITQHFSLEPLRRDDIAQYLDFRMRTAGYRGPEVFSPAAIKLIASASQGLTRRVNILAEKSLLAAFAEGSHLITPKQVDAAIRDSQYEPHRGGNLRKTVLVTIGVAAAASVAAAAILAWTPGSQAPQPQAQPPASIAPNTPIARPPNPSRQPGNPAPRASKLPRHRQPTHSSSERPPRIGWMRRGNGSPPPPMTAGSSSWSLPMRPSWAMRSSIWPGPTPCSVPTMPACMSPAPARSSASASFMGIFPVAGRRARR